MVFVFPRVKEWPLNMKKKFFFFSFYFLYYVIGNYRRTMRDTVWLNLSWILSLDKFFLSFSFLILFSLFWNWELTDMTSEISSGWTCMDIITPNSQENVSALFQLPRSWDQLRYETIGFKDTWFISPSTPSDYLFIEW